MAICDDYFNIQRAEKYSLAMCQVDQGGGPGKRPTTAGKKIKTQANELVGFVIELIIFIVIIKNPPPPPKA